MEKYRYLGSQPYCEEHQNIFFGRSKETYEILHLISNNSVVLLHAQAGIGKTSVIQAGLIPKIKNDKKLQVYKIRFGEFQLEENQEILLQRFYQNIKEFIPNSSYLDKIYSNSLSLWYYLKKLQANYQSNEQSLLPVLFIFDQFEEFFTYSLEAQTFFFKELSSVLSGNIPEVFTQALNEKLNITPDFLTKEGLENFHKPLAVKVLFSFNSIYYSSLGKFVEFIPNLFSNVYQLQAFDERQAKETLIFPAIYKSKYISENNFKSQPFDYSDEALEKIFRFLAPDSNSTIDPFLLQTICAYAEYISVSQQTKRLTSDEIGEIEAIFSNYFEQSIINHFTPLEMEKVRLIFEDALIFDEESRRLKVYEGILLKNYNIDKSIVNKLLQLHLIRKEQHDSGDCFYEISYQIFVPYIIRTKLIRKEQELKENEARKQKENQRIINEKQAQKAKINFIIVSFIALALVISILFGFYATSQRNLSEKNAALAKSNLLAFYAFQELENNPTFSLRLAEEALKIDKDNPSAFSALLNAYYSTNTFYLIVAQIDKYTKIAFFSADGKYLLASHNDLKGNYEAQLIDMTGKVIQSFKHDGFVNTATISADGKYVLTTSWDKYAKLWDIKGNLIHAFSNHNSYVWNAAFSPDGTKIVSCGADRNALVWDLQGNVLATLSGHEADVYSAEFSRDGKFIITTSNDNSAKYWSVDGNLLNTLKVKDDNRFSNTLFMSASFSPDGKYIITTNNDQLNKFHSARIWDLQGNQIQIFIGHQDWLNSASFTNDGKYVLTTSRDKTIRIWDLSGKQIKILKGHESNVWHAVLLSDEINVVSVSEDKTMRKWNIGNLQDPFAEKKSINCASISPDGLTIFTASKDTATLWNLLGDQLVTLKGHKGRINSVSFSSDGKFLATASSDSTAKIWKTDGKLVFTLNGNKDKINWVAFSHDGKYIVTACSDSSAAIWDFSGRMLKKLIGHRGQLNSARFSPGEDQIITSSNDSTAIIWDLNGNIIQKLVGHENPVTSASFSPDGSKILTSSNDQTARIWTTKGKQLMVLKGYEKNVNSAEFSTDGKFIITTSDDFTARLWNLFGKEIIAFKHDGEVKSASFAPNGKFIITVFRNDKVKTIKIWLVAADDILHRIKIKQFGNIWELDDEAKKKFGINP